MEYTPEQRDALQDPDKEELIRRAREEVELQLLVKANVLATGIGLRVRDGDVEPELTLKVYVGRKIKDEFLDESDLIPREIEFDGQRIPVDVEVETVPEAQIFTLRARPVVGGNSVGPTSLVGAGTAGCVITLDDGEAYILSNDHVLSAAGQIGVGADIIQPALNDGGSAARDVVATLSNRIPIDFGTTTITILGIRITLRNDNNVDAALAQLNDGFSGGNRAIYWTGPPSFTVLSDPPTGFAGLINPVQKMGRTTEYTVGRVTDVSWNGNIDYSRIFGNAPGTNLARFVDQIRVNGSSVWGSGTWSMPGDSGSLVTDARTMRPVGLHFAGNTAGTVGYANPIRSVMRALNINRI